MARVTLHYDDGSKIDFADQADAVFHVSRQGLAGVVELRQEFEDEQVLLTRDELEQGAAALNDGESEG